MEEVIVEALGKVLLARVWGGFGGFEMPQEDALGKVERRSSGRDEKHSL